MNKKTIIFLVVLGILIIALLALFVKRMFFFNENKNSVKIKVMEKIEGYPYSLEDRDGSLYKKHYKNLKTNLTSSEIDEDAYLKDLVTMFVIDFYTLDNKVNKYDVGGLDFLYPDDETFKDIAIDTYYKNVHDNTYKKRKQTLPTVTKVNITDIEDMEYKIDKEKYDSYLVHVNFATNIAIDINKNLMITVVRDNNQLYIVKVEGEDIKE